MNGSFGVDDQWFVFADCREMDLSRGVCKQDVFISVAPHEVAEVFTEQWSIGLIAGDNLLDIA